MQLIPMEYDDFPKGHFRYWEDPEIEKDDYFYEVYVRMIDGQRANVNITRFGVSIQCEEGHCFTTDIEPMMLFPDRINSLEWEHIEKILKLIVKGEANAKCIPKETIDDWYEEWEDLGKP